MHEDALDIFENNFRIFAFSLEFLTHDAEELCDEMGNYNVPWEIQHDVAEGGRALLLNQMSYLDEREGAGIERLAEALMALPVEAICPPGLLTNNRAGSLAAMTHPSWAPIRVMAKEVLETLRGSIARNAAIG